MSQVERLTAALKASQVGGASSPTRKLNRAINEENEHFIGSELEQQQQIVRCLLLILCTCLCSSHLPIASSRQKQILCL